MGFRQDILSFAQKVPPWSVNLVASAFILKDKKLLLVRQKNHTHWTPPGGLIGFGEDLKKALVREVKEEIGVKIKILGTLSPIIRWGIDEENRVLVIFNFVGKIEGGRLTKVDRNDEGDVAEFAWVGLSDWNKYEIAPATREIFEEAIAHNLGVPSKKSIRN